MATTEEGSGIRRGPLESPGKAAGETGTFASSGEYWTLGYRGANFPLKDIKGLRCIQRLLQHPGEEFHSLNLLSEAATTASAEDSEKSPALPEGTDRIGGLGDAGEMLDARAKQDYKRKLHDLSEELEDLRERGNHQRAEQVESEIEFVKREIRRAVGLGGRDRRAGSAAERARLNVTRAIKAALQKISEQQAAMGELLERSIKTGSFCSYSPDPRLHVTWQFSLGRSGSPAEAATVEVPFAHHETSFLRAFTDGPILVGREAERSALSRFLEQAFDGAGRLVLIGGAAGVGKTRIGAEIAAEASRRGMRTFVGSCYDRDDPVPFIPFVEILEEALAQTRDLNAFREALGNDAPEMARLLPRLRRLFPDIPRPLEMPAEQSRRILFGATSDFFARVARNTPLLILIDDLHWADEGTLLLLSHLAQLVPHMPILIVGTYRDFELDPGGQLTKTLDELIRRHQAERISLGGLSKSVVAEMLYALSGRTPPDPVVQVFYSYTEGNPFFIEELFLHLVERGKLTDANGEFRKTLSVADIDVPQSVRLVIGRRLGRLSDGTQKILGSAAVIGRSFTFELLEASTAVEADALLDCIDEAERAGLIASSLQYPEVRFKFAHELIRRAVLDGQSAPRRQRLHLRVAETIEHLYRNALDDHVEDLAHHLWRAGAAADSGKTIRYLQMAGEKAVQRSANAEAINHFRNALQLIKTRVETPERLRQELTLNTALGSSLVATKGFSSLEVGRVFARARELSQQVGETPQLFHALWGLWINYASRSEYAAGFEMAEQCLRLAQTAGDSSLLVEGHHALGVSCITAGEFARGLEHLEQAVAIYNPVEHDALRFVYGQDAAVACLFHAGWALWFLGYPDKALQRNDEGIAMARRLKHPATMAMAASFGSLPYQLCRDAVAVQELTAEALAVSTEHDLAFYRVIGAILGGWALTQRGQRDEGIARMRLGLEAFRAADAVLMLAYFSSVLAEVYLEIGQASEGLRVLDTIDGTHDRYWVAELHRLRGELLLKQKDGRSAQEVEAKAEGCFRQALVTAREQQAKSLELRVAISMGRLWISAGRCPEGPALMSETLGWFTEGFATPDLREASLLLADLQRRDASLGKSV
ncbi:AAA family ATPase [Candidatus Binatus sp.]|uniref:ATP-binding protein n=1 Tax=Candidatus Binatus sp. TaxID=2811406 RepID=UPI003C907F81